MALYLTRSNNYLKGLVNPTISPKLVLTNSSSYNSASVLATVLSDEVSGNGYARQDLAIESHSIQPGGDSLLVFQLATVGATGGAINFDRAVLIADGDWIGYWQYPTTQTIANGQVYPFRKISLGRADQGKLFQGANGLPAFTYTTANFNHPNAIGDTVAVLVGDSSFVAVGAWVYFDDGVNQQYYQVSAVQSSTLVTLQRAVDGLAGGTVMHSGGKIVPAGIRGADGVDGVVGISNGLRYISSPATLPASPAFNGELEISGSNLYLAGKDRAGVDVTSILSTLGQGTIVTVTDETDTSSWVLGTLNYASIGASASSWFILNLNVLGSGTTINTASKNLRVTFMGGKNTDNTISAWFTLLLDLGSASPTAKEIGTNTASFETTTTLYISKTCSSSVALSDSKAFYLLSTITPRVSIVGVNGNGFFKVSSITDSGDFYTVSGLVEILSGSFASDDVISISFYNYA